MVAQPPAGGWPGIGAYVRAQQVPASPAGDAAAAAAAPKAKPEVACPKCHLNESRLASREAECDRLNSLVDTQAATIADLEAKVHLLAPKGVPQQLIEDETIRRLQAADATQRRTIAFLEARVLQLISELQGAEIEVPTEPDLPGWNR